MKGSVAARVMTTDLDRLVQIELTDMRRAISEWVDDGLLAEKMRRLHREAKEIRERLELDRRRPTTLVSY